MTRPTPTSNARLLLPTAGTLEVEAASAAGTVFSKSFALAADDEVRVVIPLAPKVLYDIVAKAKDAQGNLVFAGSTQVRMAEGLRGSLSLFPVDASGSVSWPTVSADAVVPALSLAANSSTSFRLAWASGTTTYRPPTLPEGLSLFVQALPNGELVGDGTVNLSPATTPQGALLTFYSPTAQTLAAVGSFVTPVATFALGGPASLVIGKKATLSVKDLVPSYSSDSDLSDYRWSATGSGSVSAGVLRASAVGTVTVTATALSTGAQAQLSVVTTDPATITFVPRGFETLDFGQTALTMDASSDLTVTAGTAALQAGGKEWEWLIDGTALPDTKFTCVFSVGDPATGDLHLVPVGLHTLSVKVILDSVLYSASIPLNVNPVEAP